MTVLEASIDVDAPPEQVWPVVSDPRNLPRWNRHIVRVEGVPKDGLREGSEYVTYLRFVGATARTGAKVLELKPPRYAKVRLNGLVDGIVETWLDRLPPDRTRLRHRVDYRFKGGPLGDLAAKAIGLMGASRLLNRGIQAQRRHAEARG